MSDHGSQEHQQGLELYSPASVVISITTAPGRNWRNREPGSPGRPLIQNGNMGASQQALDAEREEDYCASDHVSIW